MAVEYTINVLGILSYNVYYQTRNKIIFGLNNLFSLTWIKVIENSLTIPGFPQLFVKWPISRFSRPSRNPV